MRRVVLATLIAVIMAAVGPLGAGEANATPPLKPQVKEAVAVGTSAPVSQLPAPGLGLPSSAGVGEHDFGLQSIVDKGHTPDGALQSSAAVAAAATPAPLFTFEGPSNQDNFNVHGFRVNPPDPVGDVGKDEYVAMVNLVFSIYDKEDGTLLGGPFALGSLWADFPVADCAEQNGDGIVTYDEISNRWILTQFTVQGPEYFICIAVSHTPDPLGRYDLYAFSTGDAFPDYPKYGVWRDSFVVTTREFDNDGAGPEQIGIYALKRTELHGSRKKPPRMVQFILTGPPNLVGDGLLPADVDGRKQPHPSTPIPIVGSQDDGGPDGATFDALNIFHLNVKWSKPEDSTFGLTSQIPIAPYDTIYPCGPAVPMTAITTRDCLEQPPPATNTDDRLDILSYRQRPMHRLQYRNFGKYETLVTNQAVEASPSRAGIRWWELRNAANPVLFQEGTWAPDATHRWMGSVAMDAVGNIALGYSVTSTTVFPGIRYAGRAPGDPPGTLSNEQVLQAGSGVQTSTNSRWGDYTSMNLDPDDECTFYYMNEYYTAASQASSPAGWVTRIGAFKFPGCKK